MREFKNLVTRLAREEDGASASEYAILVAVIAAIVFVAAKQFDLNGIFATAGNKVKNCVNATGSTC